MPSCVAAYPVEKHLASLPRAHAGDTSTLEQMGFERSNLRELRLPSGTSGGRTWFRNFLFRIGHYHERRDYPALKGLSYLSVHLPFETVSIRELVAAASSRDGPGARTWLSELIWREFLLHDPAPSSASHEPRVSRTV